MHMRLKLRMLRESQSENHLSQFRNLLYQEDFHLDNLAISSKVISAFKIFYLLRSYQS